MYFSKAELGLEDESIDFTCTLCHGCVLKSCSRLQEGISAMEILRIGGVRILDDEFRGLLEAVCGLQGKGGAFQACVKNPEICDRLLRSLALRDLGGLGAPPIAAGGGHTCAIKSNGQLLCWGSDYTDFGQCDIPKDLGPVVAVAAGELHTCAVKANGDLVCFGDNEYGQCDVPADLGPVVAVAAGGYHTCAVKANGQLVCWGSDYTDFGQCDIPKDLGPVVAVAAGELHTCAVKANGDLVCFGDNEYGQCDVPADLGPVVAVAAGGYHTCAVKANGQLVCFGDNECGQCDVPRDLGPVVVVAAGCDHTCAVKHNGELLCFGRNDHGQCNVPVDLGQVVAVAASVYTTCAVKDSGDVVCFGNPVGSLAGLDSVVAVTGGELHICALRANGDLVCCFNEICGRSYGQCDVPTDLGPFLAVAAGHLHTCAVGASGDVICFGEHRNGKCAVPDDLGALWSSPSNGNGENCIAPEPAVVQRVDHSEPAATIPADEAAAIASQQQLSLMEHNLDSVGWHNHEASLQGHGGLYRVVVLHFSRSPPELKDVLESSDELQAVQRQLQQAGLSWTLPSEAKVLLAPRAYRALLRHLSSNPSLQEQLQKYHVLVSEDLEQVVMAQVKKLRSKLQVRLSNYETLSFGDAASSSDSAWSMQASAGSGRKWILQDNRWRAVDMDIVLYRSFIEFRPHVEDIPDTATQSTSQARPGLGYGGNIVNPRTAATWVQDFEV